MSHISDVLDITRYDAGKLKLRPVFMNIGTLVQDIVDNQSGAAAANQTTLDWGWNGESMDWIYADKERIQHILMNVVGNAVKFTHGGLIAVSVQVIGRLSGAEALQITVRDTGIGMDETLKMQIFNDFMTGDVSYDREVGGTGLGLGIAQRFVKALGGIIEVESAVGEGSTFVTRFPIVPSEAPRVAEFDATRQIRSDPGSILLVEDNEINRAVAREMLRARASRDRGAEWQSCGGTCAARSFRSHFDGYQHAGDGWPCGNARDQGGAGSLRRQPDHCIDG